MRFLIAKKNRHFNMTTKYDDDDEPRPGDLKLQNLRRRSERGRIRRLPRPAFEAVGRNFWKSKKFQENFRSLTPEVLLFVFFLVSKEIFQFQKMHIDIQKEHGLTSPIGGCPTQLGCQLCTAYPWAEIVKWKRIGTNSLLLWNGYTPVI